MKLHACTVLYLSVTNILSLHLLFCALSKTCRETHNIFQEMDFASLSHPTHLCSPKPSYSPKNLYPCHESMFFCPSDVSAIRVFFSYFVNENLLMTFLLQSTIELLLQCTLVNLLYCVWLTSLFFYIFLWQ